jgi:hypothetical protein
MDGRLTLSSIAHSTSTQQLNRIASNNEDQNLALDRPNDLPIESLQRHPSSRVNIIIFLLIKYLFF